MHTPPSLLRDARPLGLGSFKILESDRLFGPLLDPNQSTQVPFPLRSGSVKPSRPC
jgi:hypothetical protein